VAADIGGELARDDRRLARVTADGATDRVDETTFGFVDTRLHVDVKRYYS
jgi:hypothetical protein